MTICPKCSRPRLLDLFSCAGGAGMGYHRAGFCVTGVDKLPQPDYPFDFVQADALAFLREHAGEFSAIHASPPCQAHTSLTQGNRGRDGWFDLHEDMISPTRELLDQWGGLYVIENVPRAPVRRDLMLCGEMFGLRVIRHRHFELGGWWMEQPTHPKHRGKIATYTRGVGGFVPGHYIAVYGHGGGEAGQISDWQEAMGIDWTDSRRALAEAIPPAYTEHIGSVLMEVLSEEIAA